MQIHISLSAVSEIDKAKKAEAKLTKRLDTLWERRGKLDKLIARNPTAERKIKLRELDKLIKGVSKERDKLSKVLHKDYMKKRKAAIKADPKRVELEDAIVNLTEKHRYLKSNSVSPSDARKAGAVLDRLEKAKERLAKYDAKKKPAKDEPATKVSKSSKNPEFIYEPKVLKARQAALDLVKKFTGELAFHNELYSGSTGNKNHGNGDVLRKDLPKLVKALAAAGFKKVVDPDMDADEIAYAKRTETQDFKKDGVNVGVSIHSFAQEHRPNSLALTVSSPLTKNPAWRRPPSKFKSYTLYD